jgi:putative PIN family toxin of toxin-antitoxin system
VDKKLPRLVVDTNVIMSAIISTEGVPAQILKALRKNKAVLLVSDSVVQEYLEVLEYPKIQKYKKIDAEHVRDLSSFLLTLTERVELLIDVRRSPDPDDDKFLSTAVNGKADLLITGDKEDLLALKEIEGIPIVSARAALEMLKF